MTIQFLHESLDKKEEKARRDFQRQVNNVIDDLQRNPNEKNLSIAIVKLNSIFKQSGAQELYLGKAQCSKDIILKAMINALPNSGISKLTIYTNGFKPECMKSLANGLEGNKSLEKFSLSVKSLQDAKAIVLANSLEKNTHLKKFNLSVEAIGDKGAKILFNAIQCHASLEAFKLTGSRRPIPDKSMSPQVRDALARMLESKKLTDMSLTSWDMTDEDLKIFANALSKNSTLNKFRVNFNNAITDAGLLHLIEGLKGNRVLKTLDLRVFDKITQAGKKAIVEALKKDLFIEHLIVDDKWPGRDLSQCVPGSRLTQVTMYNKQGKVVKNQRLDQAVADNQKVDPLLFSALKTIEGSEGQSFGNSGLPLAALITSYLSSNPSHLDIDLPVAANLRKRPGSTFPLHLHRDAKRLQLDVEAEPAEHAPKARTPKTPRTPKAASSPRSPKEVASVSAVVVEKEGEEKEPAKKRRKR